jgi:hypothetical protein
MPERPQLAKDTVSGMVQRAPVNATALPFPDPSRPMLACTAVAITVSCFRETDTRQFKLI